MNDTAVRVVYRLKLYRSFELKNDTQAELFSIDSTIAGHSQYPLTLAKQKSQQKPYYHNI